MIISEKGLARALKRAYKRGGYNIREMRGNICIYTNEWFVQCRWENLTKKVLATIVEHIGYTHVGATAIHIEKNLEPQLMLEAVADEEVIDWVEGNNQGFVDIAPVTVGPLQLFQHTSLSTCYGVRQECMELLEDDVQIVQGLLLSEGRMIWFADGERVICKAYRPLNNPTATDTEKAIWTALESVNLR